jgi:hypothetical protein
MPSQYPLNIPFAKMSEKEGMLKFLLLNTNLLDYQSQDIFIFDEKIGTASFALYKDKHLNLVFVHTSAETGTRKVSVDLNGLKMRSAVVTNHAMSCPHLSSSKSVFLRLGISIPFS